MVLVKRRMQDFDSDDSLDGFKKEKHRSFLVNHRKGSHLITRKEHEALLTPNQKYDNQNSIFLGKNLFLKNTLEIDSKLKMLS